MTKYLLDTNIVSNPSRVHPYPAIETWVGAQETEDLYIATFTIAEVRKGILMMAAGRKRNEIQAWFDSPAGPLSPLRDHILPFDEAAALEWARLIAEGFRIGKPRSGLDMILAATAVANDCLLVTANERHFEGVIDFINPMRTKERPTAASPAGAARLGSIPSPLSAPRCWRRRRSRP